MMTSKYDERPCLTAAQIKEVMDNFARTMEMARYSRELALYHRLWESGQLPSSTQPPEKPVHPKQIKEEF